MTALLEARGASHDFVVGRGAFARKRLLHAAVDLDVTVEQGDVLGIVGESGAGKSTFGKMLLGLLPPTCGTIRFAGTDVSAIDRRSLAQKIQPVFQDPYSSLNPRRTIAAIVAAPLAVLGLGRPAPRQGACHARPRRATGALCGCLSGRIVRRPTPTRRHCARARGRAADRAAR